MKDLDPRDETRSAIETPALFIGAKNKNRRRAKRGPTPTTLLNRLKPILNL
jgi:hypothetical protein